MKLSSYIAKFASLHSEKYIFGVSGIPNSSIFEALLESEKINLVQNVHESNAVYSSIGGYLYTSKPHFCIVTAGPGVTNCVTAIGDAYLNNIPLLLISINNNSNSYGLGEKHDSGTTDLGIDTVGILKNITTFSSISLSPSNSVSLINYAYRKCIDTNKPVHLSIPKDFLEKDVSPDVHNHLSPTCYPKSIPEDNENLKQSINTCDNVLVILNRKISKNQINYLTEKAEEKNILLSDTMEHFGYMHGIGTYIGCFEYIQTLAIKKLLQHTKTIVILGGHLSSHLLEDMKFNKKQNVIHIGDVQYDSGYLGYPNYCFFPLGGDNDIKYIFDELPLGRFTKKNIQDLRTLSDKNELTHVGGNLAVSFILELNKKIPINSSVFVGVGGINNMANIFLRNLKNIHIFMPSRFLNMGQSMKSVGYAMYNKHPTFVLIGDGNFYMNSFDIITCVEHQLNINFVIFNNKGYGSLSAHSKKLKQKEHIKGFNQYKNGLNFELFAQSISSGYYGVKTINDLSEIENQIDYKKGVNIIEVQYDFYDNIPL